METRSLDRDQVVYIIETFQKKPKKQTGHLIETVRSFVTQHKIEMDLVV